MKTIRIRFFAAFRDAAGVEGEELSTGAATVGELFGELAGRHAGLQHEPAALVAVNDEMAAWDAPLNDGDEVLYFPPVAGG